MTATAAPAAPPANGISTIAMHCPSCDRDFKRRTRKGLRTSCTHCGHVMPGPEGQRREQERLVELEGQRARRRERERTRPKPPKPATPVAPGADTRVPQHPEAKPPEPEERHPNLFF